MNRPTATYSTDGVYRYYLTSSTFVCGSTVVDGNMTSCTKCTKCITYTYCTKCTAGTCCTNGCDFVNFEFDCKAPRGAILFFNHATTYPIFCFVHLLWFSPRHELNECSLQIPCDCFRHITYSGLTEAS